MSAAFLSSASSTIRRASASGSCSGLGAAARRGRPSALGAARSGAALAVVFGFAAVVLILAAVLGLAAAAVAFGFVAAVAAGLAFGAAGFGAARVGRFAGSAGSVTIDHPSWWFGRAHGRRYSPRPH